MIKLTPSILERQIAFIIASLPESNLASKGIEVCSLASLTVAMMYSKVPLQFAWNYVKPWNLNVDEDFLLRPLLQIEGFVWKKNNDETNQCAQI